jgi:protoheme IX farnesyltransferase
LEFLYTTVGTSLAIASANGFNQVIEEKLDLKMTRTCKRMLPSGRLSRRHALTFGAVTGALGSSLLTFVVDTTAGLLALANIFLYACIYTPLKTRHPFNTWVCIHEE